MGRTIFLVRHGARADFVNGEWIKLEEKPHDPPLSSLGLIQAQELAQFLKEQDVQHVFVSPYLRTLQTANPVAEAFKLPMKIENGLGECLGEAISLPALLSAEERKGCFHWIDAGYTSWLPAWYGPETEAEAQVRAGTVVRHLVEGYDGNLLIVGHGVTVFGCVQALTGNQERVQTSFCAVSRLEWNHNGWRLTVNGDITHLHDGARGIQHVISV